MTIIELIAKLQETVDRIRPDQYNTDAVVRCLDSEFDIDAIRIESFAGNENEDARTVLAIRIEPDGER